MSKKTLNTRVVDALMAKSTATGALALALKSVTTKLVQTYIAKNSETVITVTGNTKKKTAKERSLDNARLDALLGALADWPEQPYGLTVFAVFSNTKTVFDTVEAEMRAEAAAKEAEKAEVTTDA